MYLCLGYDMTFGNFSASRGWLAKVTRVVDCGLDALRGWVLLCEAVTFPTKTPLPRRRRPPKRWIWQRETSGADLDVCARSEPVPR